MHWKVVLISQILFLCGCQVDASRLLLGLSLTVGSIVCEQKAGEYLIIFLQRAPIKG